MVLEERAMLVVGDGLVASALGTDGMLMLFDFLFWLVWINFLLGFANLIPMVPFDGGHLVRDGVHSVLNGEISLGRYGRLRLGGGMHPMRIEAIANRISNMSSFFILLVLVIPIIIPRIL
jgi:membrane-associated protease RseP (regulator of RpoE activity)